MNDFLDQNEIDALLNNVKLDKETTFELTDVEKDTLAEIGNISMGSAATALSTLINRKVTITVPHVKVNTIDEIQKNYPIPCIVVNVSYKAGLQGSNLLVIREHDASIIGDLMMGNDGTDVPDQIDELSLSAVTEAMNVMMGSAATAMSDLFNYMIDISPPSTEQRDLGEEEILEPRDGTFAVIAFRLEIPDLVDSTMLQIIDLEFAKEMVFQLLANDDDSETSSEQVANNVVNNDASEEIAATTWGDLKQTEELVAHQNYDLGNLNVELIKNIPVKIHAVLGKTRMPIENILKLGPGHIMELDSLDGEPIDVYANNMQIARGEVVVVGEQFGIRITEIVTPKSRMQSIGS